jgi:hypothetical protein
MPEFNSTQMAAVAANGKILGAEQGGNLRRFFSRIVVPAGGAINDTIYFGRLPRGARIVRNSTVVSCTAGTASSVLDIGLRLTAPPNTVLDADGIAVGIDIAAAGQKLPTGAAIGAYLVNGIDDNVPTAEVDVYGTVRVALPASGQQIVVEFFYTTD